MRQQIKAPVAGRNFWGPPIWTSTHILAATYKPSPANAAAFISYLYSLAYLLPCEECKENLRNKLKIFPPDPYLSNNHDAFFYTYVLHDMVNEHISEVHLEETPKESPNYDDIKTFYFRGLSQECKECNV
jgi:hypothetical protein